MAKAVAVTETVDLVKELGMRSARRTSDRGSTFLGGTRSDLRASLSPAETVRHTLRRLDEPRFGKSYHSNKAPEEVLVVHSAKLQQREW